jgi:MraZ protein
MEDAKQGAKQPRPPAGMYPCKLDDRTRLKFPAAIARYFKELGEETLFCTSLDRRIGQIFPLSAWQENEALLDDLDDTDRAERIRFTANDLGSTVEIDSQDRIVIPQKLRDALGMEGTLQLCASRGHIEVLTESEYNARRDGSAPTAREDYEAFRRDKRFR